MFALEQDVSDGGTKAFGKAREACDLHVLAFGLEQDLSEEGAKALGQALESHTALTFLN